MENERKSLFFGKSIFAPLFWFFSVGGERCFSENEKFSSHNGWDVLGEITGFVLLEEKKIYIRI